MKRVFGVMIVLLLAVSFLAACGPGEPAEFTLSSVTVTPSAPEVGDTVTISATVTNVGEQSDDCAVSLIVNGDTDSKSVSALAGGASSSVSFSYDATTAGGYTATLSTPDDSKSKSFTVSEEGVPPPPPPEGVPTWSVGDYWVMDCSYANPGGKTEQDTCELTVTVTGEEAVGDEACYMSAGVFEPAATRDAADMPLTLHIETADIWTSKDALVYLKLSSAISELPGLPSTVTWTLTGDYGYPFDEGKTWSGSVRVVAGVLDEITDLEFKVLGVETITVPAGTFDCYHLVAYESGSPGTYVNEYWINTDEVKSVVKEVEAALWAGVETRELTSYSVS
jgi:predicted small lipoprotein YifL